MFEELITAEVLSKLGYLILFLVIFFEANPIVGVFMPGQTTVIAASILSAKGALIPFLIVFVTIFAVFSGEMTSWYLGKKEGRGFIANRKFIPAKKLKKAEKFLEKHDLAALLFSRFNPVTRAFVPFLMGAENIKSKHLPVYILISATIWAISLVTIGFLIGRGVL